MKKSRNQRHRISYEIDEKLHRRLKNQAHKNGTTIFEEFIREYNPNQIEGNVLMINRSIRELINLINEKPAISSIEVQKALTDLLFVIYKGDLKYGNCTNTSV